MNTPVVKKKKLSKKQRIAEGWGDATDTATLLHCFRWEIAQALKASFLTPATYNTRHKVTFTRDYSAKVPLGVLRDAAFRAFAPPLQRLCAALAGALSRRRALPQRAEALIFGFYFPGVLSVAGLAARCAPYCLGPPATTAAGTLTLRLPKGGRAR